MRIALPCLLLLAACGRDPEATVGGDTRKIPAAGMARVVVLAKETTLELRTSGNAEIAVDSPGDVSVEVVGDSVRITHESGALRLTVPAGFDIVARVESGAIDARGVWGVLALTALKGDVRIDADALGGGSVRALKGSVVLTIRSAPAESVRVSATSGDAALKISKKFRGLLQLVGPVIETPKDVAVRRAEGTATVFVGEGFTPEDHAKAPIDKRPGIWATAKKVSLSLIE